MSFLCGIPGFQERKADVYLSNETCLMEGGRLDVFQEGRFPLHRMGRLGITHATTTPHERNHQQDMSEIMSRSHVELFGFDDTTKIEHYKVKFQNQRLLFSLCWYLS